MLQPADLLVMDEPTNDLVLVTHDRSLLDRVSTLILALDGRGGAEYFADYGQWWSGFSPPVVSAG